LLVRTVVLTVFYSGVYFDGLGYSALDIVSANSSGSRSAVVPIARLAICKLYQAVGCTKCIANVTGVSLSLFLGLMIQCRHVEACDIVCGLDVARSLLWRGYALQLSDFVASGYGDVWYMKLWCTKFRLWRAV
jgi:hypothetical protein